MTISSHQKQILSLLQAKLIESVEVDLNVFDISKISDRNLLLKTMEKRAFVLSDLASSGGCKGLAYACTLLRDNFELLRLQDSLFSEDVSIMVKTWAAPLSSYYHSIGHSSDENAAVDVIMDFLSDPAWPLPLEPSSYKEAKLLFSEPFFVDTDLSMPNLNLITAEMSSLEMDDTIELTVANDFLTVLVFQVEAFDCAIRQFLITEDDVQLRVAHRIAHTVKGAANTVGVRGMAWLMHFAEEVLSLPVKNSLWRRKLGLVLQDVADCLSEMTEYLNALAPQPEDVTEIIQSVADFSRDFYADQQRSSQKTDAAEVGAAIPTKHEAAQKVFHLENLIAFNDSGLNRNPPKFGSKSVDIESRKTIKFPLKKLEEKHRSADLSMKVSNDEMDEVLRQRDQDFSQDVAQKAGVSLEDNESAQISDVKMTKRQREELTTLVGESQKLNAKTLHDLERYILASDFDSADDASKVSGRKGSSGYGDYELSDLKTQLLKQSQIGLAIQSLLSNVFMSQQNILVSSQSAEKINETVSEGSSYKYVFVVGVGSSQACLLAEEIQRIVYVETSRLHCMGEGLFYQLPTEPEPVEVFTLDEMLFPDAEPSSEKEYRTLLLVRDSGNVQFGVMVESISERVRHMIKLGHKSRGVIGATVLDRGEVMPVLSLLELATLDVENI